MTIQLTPQKLIDAQRYPIEQVDSVERQRVIDQVKSSLAVDGCAVLPDFLSTEGLASLLGEVNKLKSQAYYSKNKACNVYLGEGDDSESSNHPRNILLQRTNGFVTADLLSNTGAMKFYHWPALRNFLAECLEKDELFIYDDPVSNIIVNVGRKNQQFNWHYDTNEFTITLLLQEAEDGGFFEYVPNLRTPKNECYEEVKKVLSGDRDRIKQLKLKAGDLQFFKGRMSLHQVTPNLGDTDRLLLIMSFTEKPGVIGSITRVKDLYGKVTQAHLDHEANRVRSDSLID